MRPIDAVALNRELVEFCNLNDPIFGIIMNCPTLDVKPVVHAHWIHHAYGEYPICSNCKKNDTYAGYYCGNCGAKMDGWWAGWVKC